MTDCVVLLTYSFTLELWSIKDNLLSLHFHIDNLRTHVIVFLTFATVYDCMALFFLGGWPTSKNQKMQFLNCSTAARRGVDGKFLIFIML